MLCLLNEICVLWSVYYFIFGVLIFIVADKYTPVEFINAYNSGKKKPLILLLIVNIVIVNCCVLTQTCRVKVRIIV